MANFQCLPVQEYLSDLIENSQAAYRSHAGLLMALRSEQNMLAAKPNLIAAENIIRDSGKFRSLEIGYHTNRLETATSATKVSVCAVGATNEIKYVTFQPTDYVSLSTPLIMTVDEGREVCRIGNEALLAAKIYSQIPALYAALNKGLLTKWLAKMGNFYQNTPATPYTVDILKTDGTANHVGWGDVQVAYEQAAIGDYPPIVVFGSGGNVARFVNQAQYACCNDSGVNVNLMAGDAYWFRDKHIGTIFGNANAFALLEPSTMRLLTSFDNNAEAYNGAKFGTIQKYVMEDPRTGIRFDVDINENGCDDQYEIMLRVKYELADLIQPDAFAVGDPMEGVNGSTRYIGNQAP